MKTKIVKNLMAAAVVSLTSLSGFAEKSTSGSSSNPKPASDGQTILEYLSKGSHMKRIPSRNQLELFYSEGVLSLESSVCEGNYTLTLDNEDTGTIVTVPTISVGESVSIDLECGQYTVTATGSEGQSYEGFMELM